MTSTNTNRQPASTRIDWILRGGFLLGIVILVFLFGMVRAISQAPPYRTVRDAWIAFCAHTAQRDLLSEKWPAYLWTPTNRDERGLVSHDPVRSQDGYTLYTSSHDGSAVLVDRHGSERHRWAAPFRKVWPNARHVPRWLPDQFVHMRKAHVYPNGDLLAVYSTTANTPSGCGLAKLNVHGETIWTFDSNAHHDFCVGSDGTIYVLTHQLRQLNKHSDPELQGLADVPIIDDTVTILSPDGKRLKTFSLVDALVKSPYFNPLLTHVDRYGDLTHNNTINLVDESFASHYDGVSPGDLMVCLRNLNLVAIVNPKSESIVWATTGPWNHPHDPDPLANGNVAIFDNFFAAAGHHGSAIVEFNPRSRKTEWIYTGSADAPLRSAIRSRQQLLDNGNLLITESDQGRILEVTRQGDVVWEYLNPIRGGENDDLIPIVCGAHRYSADELPFLNDWDDLNDSTSAPAGTLTKKEPER